MYLDLELEIRSNGVFRDAFAKKLARVSETRKLAETDRSKASLFREALHDMVKLCRYNFIFLTPYYWPQYPKSDALDFSDYPFAFSMFSFQVGGFMVFKGSRQIAKSSSFCCRQQLNARFIPGFKSLYVVPSNSQLTTYHDRMREMRRAMRGYRPKNNKDLRKNLNHEEFSTGSTIDLVYALTSATNIRSRSCDELIFDEVQGFDADLEIEVVQAQSASRMPVTIYAGTSLTTDTLLESKFELSSQGHWITKCESGACGHYNIPIPEEHVLDMIKPDGPACAKCGRPINVRKGQFVHSFKDRIAKGFLGFHIPQIIVPSVVNNPIRWDKIYQLAQTHGGSRQFNQEILGIATEEGEKEITRQNLINICVLGKDLSVLHRKAAQRRYDFVVSGCDWGGSDYIPAQHIKISTTVHAVLGVRPDRKLDIIHMRRYSGMGYDGIAADILHNHHRLCGTALASDFGVGAAYNDRLRTGVAPESGIPPERHLIFNYTGPASELCAAPQGAHMYNQYSLNKTESISLTFEAVRSGRILCYDWDMAQEHLLDLLNLFRTPGERSGTGTGAGATTFIYRSHPSKPNDTLMAINYAFMLAKILCREPMFADISTKIRLEQNLQSDFAGAHEMPEVYSG